MELLSHKARPELSDPGAVTLIQCFGGALNAHGNLTEKRDQK